MRIITGGSGQGSLLITTESCVCQGDALRRKITGKLPSHFSTRNRLVPSKIKEGPQTEQKYRFRPTKEVRGCLENIETEHLKESMHLITHEKAKSLQPPRLQERRCMGLRFGISAQVMYAHSCYHLPRKLVTKNTTNI